MSNFLIIFLHLKKKTCIILITCTLFFEYKKRCIISLLKRKIKKNTRMIFKSSKLAINLFKTYNLSIIKNFNLTTRRCLAKLTQNQENYVDSLYNGLIGNGRAELARSITLVETTNQEKKVMAQYLLNKLLVRLKENRLHKSKTCLRIGITGPPGAGKSSIIETFGKYLTTQVGAKVAVLTVDPSSTSTGGSILGDKVRMYDLSRDPRAFIRSSPNKCNLGGVTRNTLETIFVCEAANFDVIIVETVGVGQAEHAILDMVDCMVLLIPPGSGDELQGLKKGVAELADIIAVTKYDGNLTKDAIRVKTEYTSAMKFIRRKTKFWTPQVILTSSRENIGIDSLWKLLCEFKESMFENNLFYSKRQKQVQLWFWTHLKENLLDILLSKPALKHKLEQLESEVLYGNITPG
jgi:LAO/AO transport system kinase